MALHDTPGLSVAYRAANGDVRTAVFGDAHNASGDPGAPPLSPTTLFQAGSVSKPVAALAYLMSDLAERTLDADVRPALAGLIELPRETTAAELLTHTAGASLHGFGGYPPGAPLPSIDDIVRGTPPANSGPITFETPGEWRYSGGGYMVWQAWLERTAHIDLPTFVRERLLVPAGASRSHFTHPLPRGERDAACGSDPARLGSSCRFLYPEAAAAGLWTTPTDLACIAGYVATQRPDVLVRVASRAEVVPSYPQRQGVGLLHRRANGLNERDGRMFEHSGVNYGFCTQWLFFSDGRAIAAMDNGCRGAAFRAARALCRELGWTCAGANLGLR